jgi:hypothetical protein
MTFRQCVGDVVDGVCQREYNQPVYQTVVMFIGESFCTSLEGVDDAAKDQLADINATGLIAFRILSSRFNLFDTKSHKKEDDRSNGYESLPIDPAVALVDENPIVHSIAAPQMLKHDSQPPYGAVGPVRTFSVSMLYVMLY